MNGRRLMVELQRAADRLTNVGAGRLVMDYIRAARFHLGGPKVFAADRSGRPERLVVTLSTTPSRARHLLPTLRSLIDQTLAANRIVLALPRTSRRDGAPYPDPAELQLPDGVEILACEDQGPATKLLPALAAEPAARLIVVDDDVVYPRDFLATLLSAHRAWPDAAIGYRGVVVDPSVAFRDLPHIFATAVNEPRPVDILFGTWGYLLPPAALDRAVADFSGRPEAVRSVDDIWISAHLALRGIERRVASAAMYPIETLSTLRGSLTGGINRSGENDQIALSLFSDLWTAAQRRSGGGSDPGHY